MEKCKRYQKFNLYILKVLSFTLTKSGTRGLLFKLLFAHSDFSLSAQVVVFFTDISSGQKTNMNIHLFRLCFYPYHILPMLLQL